MVTRPAAFALFALLLALAARPARADDHLVTEVRGGAHIGSRADGEANLVGAGLSARVLYTDPSVAGGLIAFGGSVDVVTGDLQSGTAVRGIVGLDAPCPFNLLFGLRLSAGFGAAELRDEIVRVAGFYVLGVEALVGCWRDWWRLALSFATDAIVDPGRGTQDVSVVLGVVFGVKWR